MYLRLRALVTNGGDGSGWVVVGWEWGVVSGRGRRKGERVEGL